MKRSIQFFDTTLRDGEQTPGIHLSRAHKLEIARQLERLGVDVIEAGFPASSHGDAAAVQTIAGQIKQSVVTALARASHADIDAAAAALQDCVHPRIHVFLATSDLHLEHKLHITRQEALSRIQDAVAYAKSKCASVEFSAEDASRTEESFLLTAVETAVRAGATVINIPDTVGYTMPGEFSRLIAKVRSCLDQWEAQYALPHICLSVHCHNDLGCAVANSLAAVQAGAEQVECTLCGIGERAGNAALEEIVMSLRTRSDLYDASYRIDTTQLTRACRLVSSLTGIALAENKAIVGANAFRHESGIHQHGMMSDKRTYEIMTPESVGLSKSNLVLGKLSGRHAFAERVAELGYEIDDSGIGICFKRFKALADKKTVCDEDIMAIVNEYMDSFAEVYQLDTFQIQSGNRSRAMAMITLSCKGTSISEAALGDGPIDAAFNAVNRLGGADHVTLDEYQIKAVTEGADALGEATVKITIDGVSYTGRSASTDIIEASIRAYVNALNKWAAPSKA